MNSDLTSLFSSNSSPLHLSYMEDGFDIWGFFHLKLWIVIFCFILFSQTNFFFKTEKSLKVEKNVVAIKSLKTVIFGVLGGSMAINWNSFWPIGGTSGLGFSQPLLKSKQNWKNYFPFSVTSLALSELKTLGISSSKE